MPVQVQCPSCSKCYAAADALVGKRARCKFCGHVFELVALPARAGAALSPSAAPGAAPIDPDLALLDERAAGLPADAEPETVFNHAFHAYVAPNRANTSYKFPTAKLLDRWLPWALAIGAMLWLALHTRSTAGDLPGWVAPFRMAMLCAIFFGLVWPLTSLAVSQSARRMRYDLPSSPRWRVLAAFSVAYALCAVFWLLMGTMQGLILGGILGLALGLAALWLFLRLRPHEALMTLGLSGAGFVIAVIIGIVVVVALNGLSAAIVKGFKTPTTMVQSPFGPGLSWVPPRPPAPAPAPAEPGPSSSAGNATLFRTNRQEMSCMWHLIDGKKTRTG